MGQGEYGGNGSVHWTNTNRKDRNNGQGDKPRTYHEVDEHPDEDDPGFFVIQVLDVSPDDVFFKQGAANRGTLTVRVPIKLGSDYTRQVRVTWPPDEIDFPPDGSQVVRPG